MQTMNKFDFCNEIDLCAEADVGWDRIDHKSILITGATGMIGQFLIRTLLRRNEISKSEIEIIAIGRDKEKFNNKFRDVEGIATVKFLQQDVQNPCKYDRKLDFIIHMASNTHPKLYYTDPIGTEMTNIIGTYYLLELAANNPGCRFVFASSGDVYGDNEFGKKYIGEADYGYVDCNTLRACYTEGKRAGEALCNAFRESKGVDYVIARFCRLYGHTMDFNESKAVSQFILNAARGEDIVLKSQGDQEFSYLYAYDAVTALLTVISKGASGEAYNIADNEQVLSLKELASFLADIAKSRILHKDPGDMEKKGASTFKNVRLDAGKLYSLGWKPKVCIEDGLRNTVLKIKDLMGLQESIR